MSTKLFLTFPLLVIAVGGLSVEICEKLPAPENGQINCDEELTTLGTKCQFKCNEGYIRKGSERRYCLNDLRWSGSSPICILPNQVCQLPPPLIHGVVVGCSRKTLPSVGQSCGFFCRDGYKQLGPTRMVCRSNGRFTDPDGGEVYPTCIALDENEQVGIEDYDDPPYENNAYQTDPCHNHTCQHICRVEEGRAQCRCNKGFILNKENQRTCDVNQEPPIHTTRPPKRTLNLLLNPCNRNNGGCAQRCTLRNGHQVFCSCYPGYVLEGDRRSCRSRTPGVTISISRWAAINRNTSVDLCSINNGGCEHNCQATNDSRTECYCYKGFKLHENERNCIDINECSKRDLNNCEHACFNYRGGFRCYCKPGFDLIEGHNCQDVDECSDEYLNKCNQICTNTQGSFACSCRPGYIITDGYKCEGCGKNKFWSFELEGCLDCPTNSHTLSDGSQSISDCLCDDGFTGNPGDDIPCYDIDECFSDNFGCSDTCNNIPGGAYCTCPYGFMLDIDNKTCIDIDECKIKNGGCEGLCINEHGSFHCICPEGYKKSNKDMYSCDDIDECEKDNGGCQHACINYRGGYYCACENGYHLDSERRNCIEIQCLALPVPPHSKVTCKHNKQKLQQMDSYPISTVCNFTCDKGFKNRHNLNIMECQEDRTWSGKLPECKPQFCAPLKVPENGAVHPTFCSRRGNKVKQRCTFSCFPGYVTRGPSIFQCKNNLTWDVEEIPVCQPEKTRPRIECPEDVVAVLLPGKSTHNITLSEPTTNMENYEVLSAEIPVGSPFEFQAGVTKVTFHALSPHSNKSARCVTTVTVLDKEPPVFEYCPDPIEIENAGANGELVTWEDPIATDNVGVETLYSIMKPNKTLAPGTYVAEYIARDAAGNIATCSFDISITRIKCPDLDNPEHGEANCVDWFQGKFCQPQCEAGYMRDPDDPDYYSCDDTGVWEPSEFIPECLKFVPLTSSTCPDGFEIKINDETSENVCLQCSSNKIWSTTSKKCEDKELIKN